MTNATTAPIKRARTAAPQRNTEAVTVGWRSATKEFLRGLSTPLAAAQAIAANMQLAEMHYLLADLTRKVGELYEAAQDGTVDRQTMLDHLYHLEVLLQAACAYRESTDEIRHALKAPLEAGLHIQHAVDSGSAIDEDAPTLSDEPSAVQRPSESKAPAAGTSCKAVVWVLSEIESAARVMKRMAGEIIDRTGVDDEEIAEFAEGITLLASQAGLLACIGQEDLGEHTMMHSANARLLLLPPSYHRATAAAEGAC